MMLYLHGNNIYVLTNVDKLVDLRKLKSLTLHGNPVEISPGYRHYIITRLPQLQTFDFSGITKDERAAADSWTKLNAKLAHTNSSRTKKKKAETKILL